MAWILEIIDLGNVERSSRGDRLEFPGIKNVVHEWLQREVGVWVLRAFAAHKGSGCLDT